MGRGGGTGYCTPLPKKTLKPVWVTQIPPISFILEKQQQFMFPGGGPACNERFYKKNQELLDTLTN